jgi:Tetracyclin repressor-like, C-terminal domain
LPDAEIHWPSLDGSPYAGQMRGYGIGDTEMNHAIRTLWCTIHGYAALQAADGFQWNADPDETFDWMIRFLDCGLRTMCPPAGNAVGWRLQCQ